MAKNDKGSKSIRCIVEYNIPGDLPDGLPDNVMDYDQDELEETIQAYKSRYRHLIDMVMVSHISEDISFGDLSRTCTRLAGLPITWSLEEQDLEDWLRR